MASEQNNNNNNLFSTVGEAADRIDDNEMRPNPALGATGEGITTTTAADAEGHPVQEIESMCVNCEQTGITRMLLTKIPYFREVIIMSFSCPHCGFKNSEIQSAGVMQEKGSRYTLKIETKNDLNRQVIKSDYCSCKFVELDIEIPAKRGQFTNVEGLLTQIKEDLAADQPARKAVDPVMHDKIEEVIAKLTAAINGEILPLTLIVDDPSGNSWVEFIPNEAAHKWVSRPDSTEPSSRTSNWVSVRRLWRVTRNILPLRPAMSMTMLTETPVPSPRLRRPVRLRTSTLKFKLSTPLAPSATSPALRT